MEQTVISFLKSISLLDGGAWYLWRCHEGEEIEIIFKFVTIRGEIHHKMREHTRYLNPLIGPLTFLIRLNVLNNLINHCLDFNLFNSSSSTKIFGHFHMHR